MEGGVTGEKLMGDVPTETVLGWKGDVDASVVVVGGSGETAASIDVDGRAAGGEMASAGGEMASAGGEMASAGGEVASAGGEVASAGGEVADGETGAVLPGTSLRTVARTYKRNRIFYIL